MKVTPIVHEATERDLLAILAIYNEVIATSTAVYSLEPSTLEERQVWFCSRSSMGFPVLVALDSANSDVLGFASFGEWRGAWPGGGPGSAGGGVRSACVAEYPERKT